MKIENIIRRVLREEQEEQILKIPGLKFFNNDWSILQKFLESQGYPRYSIGGDLSLRYTKIETLGNLVRVEGKLDLESCQNLESLENLEYVGGNLNLLYCKNLKSIGNLEYVGGFLDLWGTDIKTLGKLEYVGGDLDLQSTPLSEKYTEDDIRKMVKVVGVIDM
jgi:hypothetical protein